MKTKTIHRALLAAGLLPIAAVAHAEYVAYLPGMMLGTGYDTISGTIRQECVTKTTDAVPGPGATVSQSYSLAEVSSNADLLSITGVDASASVDVGLFSASAEMSLLSQNQISNYSANLLAEVSIERGWQFARNVALKPANQSLAQDNPDGFMRQCGNRYVAGVLYGGEFYGLVTIATASQSERTEISTAISASYGPFSASGDFSNDSMATLRNYSSTVRGYMTGAGGAALPLNLDTMRARMANFPGEIMRTGGTPMQVLLLEYPVVGYSPTPSGLYQLATLRWEYVSVRTEVDYVLREPSQFYMTIGTWQPFLRRLQTEAQTAITAVDTAIGRCKQNAANCSVPSTLRKPDQMRADLPPRYTARCGSTTLATTGFELSVLNLNTKCGGDDEMDGHNPSITVTSGLVTKDSGRELDFSTTVRMREGKRDWTCFTDSRPQFFMNLAMTYPGCYLSSVAKAAPSTGGLSANGGNDNHDWTVYSNGTGFVANAHCLSDTRGKDRGKLGCKEIHVRPIVATLDHEENRMGPNDLKRSAAAAWTNRAGVIGRIEMLTREDFTRAQTATKAFVDAAGVRVRAKPAVAPVVSGVRLVPTFRQGAAGTVPLPR